MIILNNFFGKFYIYNYFVQESEINYIVNF